MRTSVTSWFSTAECSTEFSPTETSWSASLRRETTPQRCPWDRSAAASSRPFPRRPALGTRCVSSEKRLSAACRWSRKGARSSVSCPWATLPSRAIQSRRWATSARHLPIRKRAAPRARFVHVRHEETAAFVRQVHGVVSQPIDDVIRQSVSELLRQGAPGRFLCVPCLVRLVQDVHGIAYARRQIDRSLASIVRSPGSLTYLRSFTCDRCGRTAPCLGAKPASPRGDSGV